MANFNFVQEDYIDDYKFENIKLENADTKMKAILWGLIRNEQKALAEIDKIINTIKDETLKQTLIKISGEKLDIIVKLYNLGDELSNSFRRLDETSKEAKKTEDENIARIIENINYEPQTRNVIKKHPQAPKENNTNQVIEKGQIDQVQDENKIIEPSPVENKVEEEQKLQNIETKENVEPTIQKVEEKKEEATNADLKSTEEIDNQEEKLNKDIQSLMSDIKVITEQKEVEDTTPKEEPEKKVEEVKEEPALTTQTVEPTQQEEAIVTIPTTENFEQPEIVSNSTEEKQPEIATETAENETNSLPEMVIETPENETNTVPEIVSETTVNETNPVPETVQENSTLPEIQPTIEPIVEEKESPQPSQTDQQGLKGSTTQNEEIQPVEQAQPVETELPKEEPLANIPDIQSIVKEDSVDQEEKKPDFIKTNKKGKESLLVTSKQYKKLLKSLLTQEALYTSIFNKDKPIKNPILNSILQETELTPEEMLVKANQLYHEGKKEEAEQLMEQVTSNPQNDQPIAMQNYANNEVNTIQPTDNMLNIPSSSVSNQFTIVA